MTTPDRAADRLDDALVDLGLAPTRERAQALIAAGLIELDGTTAASAAQRVSATSELRLRGRDHPWASRAGLKLDAALTEFGVECSGRVALDAGASTGGFTSVLLSRGVARVHAVDVGHGQLLPELVRDERVNVMDRRNLRTLEQIPGDVPSLVTLDLSFISLRKVMPALRRLAPGAEVVALFKPQFELPRDAIGRGGVVRDDDAGEAAATAFLTWAASDCDCTTLHPPLRASVRGTKGNQEWLLHLRLPEAL